MACGFTLMLLFDELCSSKKKKTLSYEEMKNILNNDSLSYEEKRAQIEGEKDSSVNVTTMGLVIHSLSDGIALGVSLFFSILFQQEENSLGIVIFFAILMHKIPTAVGLGTFLSKAGLPFNKVFGHLLAFTGTSPLANILTFVILSNVGLTENSEFLRFYVGVLLLVSSGTFLYVSTIHILPEVFGEKSGSA